MADVHVQATLLLGPADGPESCRWLEAIGPGGLQAYAEAAANAMLTKPYTLSKMCAWMWTRQHITQDTCVNALDSFRTRCVPCNGQVALCEACAAYEAVVRELRAKHEAGALGERALRILRQRAILPPASVRRLARDACDEERRAWDEEMRTLLNDLLLDEESGFDRLHFAASETLGQWAFKLKSTFARLPKERMRVAMLYYDALTSEWTYRRRAAHEAAVAAQEEAARAAGTAPKKKAANLTKNKSNKNKARRRSVQQTMKRARRQYRNAKARH